MEWIFLRMIPASLPFRYCSFSEREGRTSSRSRQKSEQLSTTVDVEIMNKVRALMEKEGLNKKEVVTAALIKLLHSYESVHGELRQQKEKKGKIDVLLDL